MRILEAGKTMILNFYNYGECFAHYRERIMHLNQNREHGRTNIAKPALLLAVIQLVDEQQICSNRFTLTMEVEKKYCDLYQQYNWNNHVTPICYPFYHLKNDGFWHIRWIGTEKVMDSPSKKFLRDNIDYVFLDDDLWFLLQHRDWRQSLADFIIKEKMSEYQ